MNLPTINYPTFTTNLISDNKVVEYRPFLAKESKILMMLKDSSPDEIINGIKNIVDVCTFNKLDLNTLPHFEVTNLFLKIRSKSIGEKVDIVINCKCGNKVKSQMDLDEVTVINKEEHSNVIDLDGKYFLTMRYPNIEQALNLIDADEEYVNKMIVDLIISLHDKDNFWSKDDKSDMEWQEWLDNLQILQTRKIVNFFQTAPNIKQNIKAECSKCHTKHDYNIVGLYNFFV